MPTRRELDESAGGAPGLSLVVAMVSAAGFEWQGWNPWFGALAGFVGTMAILALCWPDPSDDKAGTGLQEWEE